MQEGRDTGRMKFDLTRSPGSAYSLTNVQPPVCSTILGKSEHVLCELYLRGLISGDTSEIQPPAFVQSLTKGECNAGRQSYGIRRSF